MKILKKVVFILLLILSVNVKAAARCETEEFNRLKALSKKIEFDYSYKLVDDKAIFTLNAINLSSELKVKVTGNSFQGVYKELKGDSENKASLEGFQSGEKVSITITGYVGNLCSGKLVSSRTFRIPYYNYYYSEEKCKDHEDFKYCKLLIDKNITQKDFDAQYEKYLKSKEVKEAEPVKVVEDNKELYIIIAGVVGVTALITTIVIIIIRRKRKNSL